MRSSLRYPPILLPYLDAAEYLGVSLAKLNELQAQRRIMPRALDGKREFLRDDLDEFARSLPEWGGVR